jgi:uncharacterized membrane protein
MWDLLVKGFDLIIYYKKDQAVGRPYWEDTKLVGLVVGMVATEITKLFGVEISADLQIKIVAAAVGIGALFDGNTGIAQEPVEKAVNAAKPVQETNLTQIG